MFAFIGIGNFEKKYFNTRHNLGSYFLKKLIIFLNINFIFSINLNGFIAKYKIKNKVYIFYIPKCFINESGSNIKELLNYYNLDIKNIVIIHDDMSFLPGVFKLKFGGGSSGHNGLKNIINNLLSENFYRIRIGIGRPHKNYINFVLSNINKKDKILIYKSLNKLIICVNNFIQSDILNIKNYIFYT